MKMQRLLTIVLALGVTVGGCTLSPDQGKMVRTLEVDRLIESATVLPGHTYFFAGPEAEPDAIIAIESSFTLQSKYWIRVEEVAGQLKMWNRLLENDTRIVYGYEGFKILTPEGKQAGIWYSKFDYSVVRFPDPSSLILYAPLSGMKRNRPSLRRF